MPYDQTRKRIIGEFQQNVRLDAKGQGRDLPTAKLMLQGRVEEAPIYRFPTEMLLFNKANGRIRSEVMAREGRLGRLLDPYDAEDQAIVRGLLLANRPDENQKVKGDLRKNGQLQPGIVTCDGIVINGNRRKALFEELQEETHEEKFRYLEAHVLPSNILKSEVWLIEAGIQLSSPQQLDYSPINNLLKIREGLESGIDIEDMAARIYGMSAEKLRTDIDRLELMDEYLDDYLDKKGRYHLLEGKNEHFIDLQKILAWLERPRGAVKRDWQPDPSDVAEFKVVAFHYIRARFSHWRIRELRDLFCLREAWEELRGALELGSDGMESEGGSEATSEELSEDGWEEEESDQAPFETGQEEEDLREERQWKRVHLDDLKVHFEGAKEQQQIHKDAVAPLALVRRALRNLEGIQTDSDGFMVPELDDLLGEVIKKVNDLRRFHMKIRRNRNI